RALPGGSALVSFVKYAHTSTDGADRDVSSYLAFVLGAASDDVALVPLGSADDIEAEITRWRRSVAYPGVPLKGEAPIERDIHTSGDRLKHAIWDPLVPHLGGAARV